MDQAKQIIIQHESKIKWIFIASFILHLLCNYSRTDYNLLLYILLLFAWESNSIGTCDGLVKNEERHYSYFLLLGCILLDFIWLIAYHDKSMLLFGFEYGMFVMTYTLTIVGIAIKMGLAMALGCIEWQMLKTYLPNHVPQRSEGLQSQQHNTGSRKEMMIDDNQRDA